MKDAHITMSKPYTKEALMEYIEAAESKGLAGITILEPTYKFKECQLLYREACATYPYQNQWLQQQCQYSIIEYQNFITSMKQEEFPIEVLFGLEVSYFTQHEDFIIQMKQAYKYDVVIGVIHFLDNIAFGWNRYSHEMLWDKYNAGFLYRRYYEMMNALLTSGLFDGVAGFDSIKILQVPCSINTKHAYHKCAQLLAKHHMYVEDDASLDYRHHHPDRGLSAAFIAECKALHVPVIRVSNASKAEEIGLL